MTRNYRAPKAEPVTAEEVSAHVAATPAGAVPSMLKDAVRAAIPVTMWPSPWVIAESWLCLGDFRTPYATWKNRRTA